MLRRTKTSVAMRYTNKSDTRHKHRRLRLVVVVVVVVAAVIVVLSAT